ncbi:hypothetical protein V1525DRAFT_394278 [Lipomyces kononenkoae]|uniref:Uncharacterized protein n=1 Tax=Lipomyces kononenkoae TaxID=34357 RepID=A0ACC3TBX8_LIPKO
MSSRTRSHSPDTRDRDRDRNRDRDRDRERHRDRESHREGYSSRPGDFSNRHYSDERRRDSASSSHRHHSTRHASSHRSSERDRDRDRKSFADRDRRPREYGRHRDNDRYSNTRRGDNDRDGRDSARTRSPPRRRLPSPVTDLERNILLDADQEAELVEEHPDDEADAVDQEEEEQRQERERRERDARAQALTLEIIGDLPYAEVKPPENVLFVCKLNPITEDDDLHTFFSQCGKILSCEVVRDKKTGKSLQYAFIEYEQKQDCENAYLKMQGALIDDCRIHVDFSQSVAKLSSMWRDATNRKRAQEAREKAQKPKRRWRD